MTGNAWYDPGAPYVVSPMLGVAVYLNNEQGNTGGVSWVAAPNPLQVVGVGSLNGYLVYWQSGQWGTNFPYTLGCNIIPTPHQCWRGVPDWLIPSNLNIKVDFSLASALPWAPYISQSGSVQGPWW